MPARYREAGSWNADSGCCLPVHDRSVARLAAISPIGFAVRFQLLAFAILSSAARNPLASLTASSFAQKMHEVETRLFIEHVTV
jgi:hypothetical protein